MSKKQTILKGAFILTAAGFLSRFMGFFYRIFLSHTFGAEGVGLYQLIFPVYALCISFTCAGIETAISRTVARKLSMNQKKEAGEALILGLFLSMFFSLLALFILQKYAQMIAVRFLQEPRCAPLLSIMSYALPFSAVHSCICGYFLGMRQTKIPALSQLLEQVIRIASVFALYLFVTHHQIAPSVVIAAAGLVIGEFASSVYSANSLAATSLFSGMHLFAPNISGRIRSFQKTFRELMSLSVPLTTNRVLLNLLQSVEAISIPSRLKLYNHSTQEALSIYGVLTGMAIPLILFPSAITSSVSAMLMPTVAEIQASDHPDKMIPIIKKAVSSCFFLGICCQIFFLLFGSRLGLLLFHSSLAGKFIITLAWICPFLYSNTALLSVINGLGKTPSAFCINMAGLSIRIAGIFLAVPLIGIQGYLFGMLISQLCVSLLCLFRLYRVFYH